MGNVLQQLSQEERLVYEVIKRKTIEQGGILQVKLKELPELRGLEPQRIARIVLKLAKLGLVKRQLVNVEGRSMYLVRALTVEEKPSIKQEKSLIPIKLDLVAEIPCFYCKELDRCASGSPINPLKCMYLTNYLLKKSEHISHTR